MPTNKTGVKAKSENKTNMALPKGAKTIPENETNWKIIAIAVAILGILITFGYKYVEVRSENIELKNKINSLEAQNEDLKQIKAKYLDLLSKLITEGKLNVKELSMSLPQQDIDVLNKLTTMPVPTPTQSTIKPEKLFEIIKSKQTEKVKLSTGEYAYNSFTDKNLQEFISQNIPSQVTSELKKDNGFLDVILVIKAMNPTDRQKLLEKGATTYKQTFEQFGSVDPTGKAQTVDGQKAERLIAEAIVNLVKDLIKLSEEEFKKLQTEN